MRKPERLDLDAVKQRAKIRRMWPTGEIGLPEAWCRYCYAKIPGERVADLYATPHTEGCPVLAAPIEPDFDALVAEVERLRARYEP
jgi:hypothetical protein